MSHCRLDGSASISVLHDVTPGATLEAGVAGFGVESFRDRQRAARAACVYRGLGVALPLGWL
jgi:hypothetical protein